MSYPPSMGKTQTTLEDTRIEQFGDWLYPIVKQQQVSTNPTYEAEKATVTMCLQHPIPTPYINDSFSLPMKYTSISMRHDTGKEIVSPGIYTAYGIEARQIGVKAPRVVVTGYYSTRTPVLLVLFEEIWKEINDVFGQDKRKEEDSPTTNRGSNPGRPRDTNYDQAHKMINQDGYSAARAMTEIGMAPSNKDDRDKFDKAMKRRND
ncbi:MAG: hypothetical protein HN975_16720 [Anaerolineae bacterium]|jgi:hypothetical protein|nr:hypothetical protein [Anaerolineae bacterium]